jgi:hypothetical protein
LPERLPDLHDQEGAAVLAARARGDLRPLGRIPARSSRQLLAARSARRGVDSIDTVEVGAEVEDAELGWREDRVGDLPLVEERPRESVVPQQLEHGVNVVLRWGFVDNRPFLRCMQGYGLCLWRLGRWEEASRVFGRMLWMNPSDNQGIRFLLPAVRERRPWEEDRRSR